MSKKVRNLAIGTLVGAAAGYLTGILTAKKPGKETRQDITNAAVKTKNQAEKTIKSLNATLVDLLKEGEAILKNTKSTTKVGLINALEKAKQARTNARQVLSAIHEGDAEDRDLKKAITDANKAIEHLKTYLGKNKTSS